MKSLVKLLKNALVVSFIVLAAGVAIAYAGAPAIWGIVFISSSVIATVYGWSALAFIVTLVLGFFRFKKRKEPVFDFTREDVDVEVEVDGKPVSGDLKAKIDELVKKFKDSDELQSEIEKLLAKEM